MRFFKMLMMIASVMIVALFYVHQQVELVKLSYSIDRKEKSVKDLVDRYEVLGYNIKNLESPSYLQNTLNSREIEVTFPKVGHVINLASSRYIKKRIKPDGRDMLALPDNSIVKMLTPRAEVKAY